MLIGRRDQVTAVTRSLAKPGLTLLTGPAGIGKTALAAAAILGAKRPLFSGGGLRALSEIPGVAIGRAVAGRVPTHDTVLAAEAVRLRVGDGVLLLDDAQWSDRLSLVISLQVALRARVIVCVRTLTPGARQLAQRLALDAKLVLELSALGAADAAELVRHSIPDDAKAQAAADPSRVDDVVRRGGGNPLALRELARSDGTGMLRQAVAAALAELPQQSRTALAAIGALGRPAPVGLIGPAVNDLLAAGLVEISDGGAPLARATEPAIAELAFGLLPADQRAALHIRVAAIVPDAEAAIHYAEAGAPDDAVAAARRGAAVATTEAERIRLGVFAIRLSGDRVEVSERHELASRALGLEDLAAVTELISSDYQLRGTERAERTVLRAELALALGNDADALDALDGPGPPAPGMWANRFAVARAAALLGCDPAAAAAQARDVLAGLASVVAASESDPTQDDLGGVTAKDARHQLESDDVGTRLRIGAQAKVVQALAMVRLGRAGWSDLFVSAARDAEAGQSWVIRCRSVLAHAEALLEVGRPEEAARLSASFAEVCRARHALTWALRCEAVVLWARLHVRGEVDAVIEVGSSLLAGAAPRDVTGRVAGLVALALADAGNPHAGRRLLEAHAVGSRLAEWTFAELALLAGDYGLAEITAGVLSPGVDLVGRLAPLTAAFAAYAAEAVEAPDLDGQRDAQAWLDAADEWHEVMRREELRARWAAGAVEAEIDAAQGLPLLLMVHRTAGEWGLLSLQSLIGSAIRRAGGSPPAARSGGDGLPTVRERQVLDLVADGLSSRAIAAQLGLSVLTVDSHVRSAMATLGAPTRLAAALRARELE